MSGSCGLCLQTKELQNSHLIGAAFYRLSRDADCRPDPNPVVVTRKRAFTTMPGGRPTKFNPHTADKIIAAVKAGNYMETAAQFAGITKETLYVWMKEGRTHKNKELEEFSDALYRAIAEAEARDVFVITKAAAAGIWQASAWRLERKFPQRWGRTDKHEVSGPDGGPIARICRVSMPCRRRSHYLTVQKTPGF